MAVEEAALDGDGAAFYRWSRGRLAQLARALARHARGHRFKSCSAHFSKSLLKCDLHTFRAVGSAASKPEECGTFPQKGFRWHALRRVRPPHIPKNRTRARPASPSG